MCIKTGEGELAEIVKRSITDVIDDQREDGSWYYREDKISPRARNDNFHKGFILERIEVYTEATEDNDCISQIRSGLTFHQNNS